MKRKLCLALSAVMLTGPLVGCLEGTNGLSGDTSKTSEAPASKKAEGTLGGSVAGEVGEELYTGTTICVPSMIGQISDTIGAYLDNFERETGIKVNLELYGGAQLREKITTEFLAGSSTIDASLMSPLQDMTVYSSNGWIEPLDEYSKDPDLDWDDFSPVPMEWIGIKSDRVVGALPPYSFVQLMSYQKDVLEERRVKIPTNYGELLDVCERINDPTNNFYATACHGGKIALTSQFSPFLYGFGDTYLKDRTCALNAPGNLEATRFYGKLLGDYVPEDILTTGYSQVTQLFNTGQVGMCVDTITLYQTLTDPNELSFYDKVGVVPIPEGPTGHQSYKRVVWGASICSGSKSKEAVWEFLKYAAGKGIAAGITPKGMPTFRTSVWRGERVTATVPEDYIQVYNKEIQVDTINQYGLPRMIAVFEARDAMGGAIVYSIETKGEGTDLESKMNVTAGKADQLLKDAGEYGVDYPCEG